MLFFDKLKGMRSSHGLSDIGGEGHHVEACSFLDCTRWGSPTCIGIVN